MSQSSSFFHIFYQSLLTHGSILSPTFSVSYKTGSSMTAKPAVTPPSLQVASFVLISVPKFSLCYSLPVWESKSRYENMPSSLMVSSSMMVACRSIKDEMMGVLILDMIISYIYFSLSASGVFGSVNSVRIRTTSSSKKLWPPPSICGLRMYSDGFFKAFWITLSTISDLPAYSRVHIPLKAIDSWLCKWAWSLPSTSCRISGSHKAY